MPLASVPTRLPTVALYPTAMPGAEPDALLTPRGPLRREDAGALTERSSRKWLAATTQPIALGRETAALHWNLDNVGGLSVVVLRAMLQPIGISHIVGPVPCTCMGLLCRLVPGCDHGQVLPPSWSFRTLHGGGGTSVSFSASGTMQQKREVAFGHGRARGSAATAMEGLGPRHAFLLPRLRKGPVCYFSAFRPTGPGTTFAVAACKCNCRCHRNFGE